MRNGRGVIRLVDRREPAYTFIRLELKLRDLTMERKKHRRAAEGGGRAFSSCS